MREAGVDRLGKTRGRHRLLLIGVDRTRLTRVCLASLSWVVTLVDHVACAIAGGFLRLFLRLLRRGRLLNTSHSIRPLLAEAFKIKLRDKFRQRQLPWLLVMV